MNNFDDEYKKLKKVHDQEMAMRDAILEAEAEATAKAFWSSNALTRVAQIEDFVNHGLLTPAQAKQLLGISGGMVNIETRQEAIRMNDKDLVVWEK